jgi:AcrR family transcriptional regulator
MARTVGSNGPRTWRAIRRAGLSLIFEHGYEAVSLRQLAAKAGIQAGSLYNHIKTKQELLFDLIKVHMEELLAALEAELAGKENPRDALEAFITFHVDYHIARKQEVFISYSEMRSLEPKNNKIIVGLRRRYESRLIRILDEGKLQGQFTVADTRFAAYGILSMLTGVCTWFDPQGRLTAKDVLSLYRDMLLNGLIAHIEEDVGPAGAKPGAAESSVSKDDSRAHRKPRAANA